MWDRLNSRTMGVEGKAYIVLYACSLSHALYMDLVSSLETREFILSLKKLIARKGRPQKIYLDHGSIFEGATRWLRKAMCVLRSCISSNSSLVIQGDHLFLTLLNCACLSITLANRCFQKSHISFGLL